MADQIPAKEVVVDVELDVESEPPHSQDGIGRPLDHAAG
jgi:hypothetical protein